MNIHFNAIMISLTLTMLLFLFYVVSEFDSNNSTSIQNNNQFASKMTETYLYENYEQLHAPESTIVIYPIFTQSAYEWGGLHDFYTGICESCTTIEIQNFYEDFYSSSGNAFKTLEFLGYNIVDDIEIDKNPSILENYDKVILLHNEFVTMTEFNAISSHPNVVYLYPNALSSMIEADYTNNTITLIRGPGYPSADVSNGFDWEHDNSEFLNDWDCNNWKFYKVSNGYMLNCYPEIFLKDSGTELLLQLKNL